MTPEAGLAGVLVAHRPERIACFGSPGRPATPPNLPHVLTLAFHDIAEERAGHVAPSRDDVATLIAFAHAWDGERALVLQCWMGVSRSTAGALIVGATRGADVGALATRMRAASPAATPNPLMLAHADALLGLDGGLVAAGRAIGRGAVPVAHPFVLRLAP